jgi:hypothetical protein
MSSRTTIDPLSITDGKISNQAKINPKKVAPADEASFLITQNDRKYQPKKIHGDGTIDASGKLTITSTTSATTVVAEEEVLPPNTVKIGPSSYYHGDTNVTKVVGEGPSAIPVRDTSGNLKAETATNADKLDNQASDFYTNADNATAGTSTTSTVGTQTTATQNHPNTKVVATVSGTDGSGPNPASSATIAHNLGFIPSVSVVTVDGSTITPIETEVANGVNSTTITLTQTIGSLVGNPDLEVRLG